MFYLLIVYGLFTSLFISDMQSINISTIFCLPLVAEEYRQKMVSKRLLNPPVLSNIEEIDLWLHDSQVWQCLTDLEKKQQGQIIYLSLLDKDRRYFCDKFK